MHLHRLTLLAALLLPAGAAWALDLTIEVISARSDQGTVGAAVYDSAESWLAAGKAIAQTRGPAGEKTLLVYRNLPAGRYALSAFHDENGNGKLDANAIGMPTERFGFSRDARGRMGPPAFDSAAVELQADTTLTIVLR